LLGTLITRKSYWECVKISEAELQELRRDEDPASFAAISFSLMEALNGLGQYDKAEKAARDCIKLHKSRKGSLLHDTQEVCVYFDLCRALSHGGNIVEARDAFQYGLQLIDCYQIEGRALTLLLRAAFDLVTVAYEDAGDLEEAYQMDERLRELCERAPAPVYQFAACCRRMALRHINAHYIAGATAILDGIVITYKNGFDLAVNWSFPDTALEGWHRALELTAEFFEERGSPQQRDTALRIRAEVDERVQIEKALKEAMLMGIREEAARDINLVSGGGDRDAKRGRKKKSGKARRKARGERERPRTAPATLAAAVMVESHRGDSSTATQSDGDGEECATCLLPMEAAPTEMLPCGHEYHNKCLELWRATCLRSNWIPTCPHCRAQLKPATGGSE